MNTNTSSKPQRLYHIDGIKGLLCLMIMLGHYWNIYRHLRGASPLDSRILDCINDSFLRNQFLLATFWLYAFLVISGYLVSHTSVQSIAELADKTVKRFLRFFLPVLGACLIIWLIQQTVGFHAKDTAAYFTSSWYQKFYKEPLPFRSVWSESVRAMFSAACRFNSPFWVIRDMFVSSFLIYVCTFVDFKAGRKTHILLWLILVFSLWKDNQVILACFSGYIISYYREFVKKKNYLLLLFLFALLFSGCWIVKSYGFLSDIFDDILLYIIFYCFLLITVNLFPIFQKILSWKPFLLISNISFGVYAFHWPVICSFGSLALIFGITHHWSGGWIFFAAFCFALLCTFLIAILYLYLVEKPATLLVRSFRIVSAKNQNPTL